MVYHSILYIELCFIVLLCVFALYIKYSSILYSLKIEITCHHNCTLNNGDNDNGDGDDGGDGDNDADDEIMPVIASIGTFRAVSKFIIVKFHSMKLSFLSQNGNYRGQICGAVRFIRKTVRQCS
jgi:hypothetical protein